MRNFTSTAKLSHLKLTHAMKKKFRLTKMFNFDCKLLTSSSSTVQQPTVQQAVSKLLPLLCSRVKLDMERSVREKANMHSLVPTLLEPLTETVILEQRIHGGWVKSNYKDDPKVQASHLGRGVDSKTWYGSLDGRLRGGVGEGEVVVLCEEHSDDEESDGEL